MRMKVREVQRLVFLRLTILSEFRERFRTGRLLYSTIYVLARFRRFWSTFYSIHSSFRTLSKHAGTITKVLIHEYSEDP